MPGKHGWAWIGAGLSLVLVVVLLWRLDWASFRETLHTMRPLWAAGTVTCMVLGIAVRASRWNLLADVPLQRYAHFWRAANLGYLGNLIYPARAGEFLRMAAISRFAQVPAGAAVTSAVMDRVADGLLLALLLLVVILHGTRAQGPAALIGVVGGFGAIAALAMGFVLWGERLQAPLTRRLARATPAYRENLLRWYGQAIVVTRAMRHPRHMLSVGLLTLVAFALDCLGYWFLLAAFGWSLPPIAALTVAAFIGAGASLPSAPGYIGIYQVACVMALQWYGVAESPALAYSVVIQLLVFLVIGVQGGWTMISCGLRLSELSSAPARKDL